jgi:hypothetical protein
MKSSGAILAFTHERNVALLSAYRQCIRQTPFIRLDDIGRRIVNSPAPRFWVSEERASAVISAMIRGKPVLKSMRHSKQEMFLEIYNRVINLKLIHPSWTLALLISTVINQPAPKFYMEPSSALERLFKIRKQYAKKHI